MARSRSSRSRRLAPLASSHTIEEAQDLKAKLEATKVKLTVKAGREGRLFGSVKTADVADAVKAAGIGELDKRKIELPNPIKVVGDHEATVRLRDDLSADDHPAGGRRQVGANIEQSVAAGSGPPLHPVKRRMQAFPQVCTQGHPPGGNVRHRRSNKFLHTGWGRLKALVRGYISAEIL